jgi:hypothetical protein
VGLLVRYLILQTGQLLRREREVPVSNLALEIGYPDWGFLCFYSVRPRGCRDSTLNLAMNASTSILYNSLFLNHPIIRRSVVWSTDSQFVLSRKWTFYVSMGCDYVCVELRPRTGPISIPQMIYDWICSTGGMILPGEIRRSPNRSFPSVTMSTTVRGPPRERIRASAQTIICTRVCFYLLKLSYHETRNPLL